MSFTTSAENSNGTTTTTTTTSSTTTSTVGSGTTTTTTVTSTTTSTMDGGAGSLNLAVGWNLVGNGHETGFDVSGLFGDSSLVTSVWKWIAASTKWAFYAPSLSVQTLTDYALIKGYEVLSRIEPGEGFWVNSKLDYAVSMPAGTAVASSSFSATGSRPLGLGWSLIATGNTPTPTAFNNALSVTSPAPAPLPLNVISIWAWDTVATKWYFWAPSLVNTKTLQSYTTSKDYLDFTTIPNLPMGTLSPYTGIWVNRP